MLRSRLFYVPWPQLFATALAFLMLWDWSGLRHMLAHEDPQAHAEESGSLLTHPVTTVYLWLHPTYVHWVAHPERDEMWLIREHIVKGKTLQFVLEKQSLNGKSAAEL